MRWASGAVCMQITLKSSILAVVVALTGCAAEQAPFDASASNSFALTSVTSHATTTTRTTSAACRKLDALHRAFTAGTITAEEYDARSAVLVKPCQANPFADNTAQK